MAVTDARIRLEGRLEVVEAATARLVQAVDLLRADAWAEHRRWHHLQNETLWEAVDACAAFAEADDETARASREHLAARDHLQKWAQRRLGELGLPIDHDDAVSELASHLPLLIRRVEANRPERRPLFGDSMSEDFGDGTLNLAAGSLAAAFESFDRAFLEPALPRLVVTQRVLVSGERVIELGSVLRIDATHDYLTTWTLIVRLTTEPLFVIKLSGDVLEWFDRLREKGVPCIQS